MPGNPTEIAFPLASGALLLCFVAQTLWMKGGWTLFATDKLARAIAESALVCITISYRLRTGFGGVSITNRVVSLVCFALVSLIITFIYV